jgi:hypothetical protein
MSRFLLLAATVLLVCLGAVSAEAISSTDQAAYAELNRQLQSANPVARMSDEDPALNDQTGVQTASANSDRTNRTFSEDLANVLGSTLLLGITALVIGLSAVGVKALWILDQTEYSPYETMNRRVTASSALTEERSLSGGEARHAPAPNRPDRTDDAIGRAAAAPSYRAPCYRLRAPKTAMESGRCH